MLQYFTNTSFFDSQWHLKSILHQNPKQSCKYFLLSSVFQRFERVGGEVLARCKIVEKLQDWRACIYLFLKIYQNINFASKRECFPLFIQGLLKLKEYCQGSNLKICRQNGDTAFTGKLQSNRKQTNPSWTRWICSFRYFYKMFTGVCIWQNSSYSTCKEAQKIQNVTSVPTFYWKKYQGAILIAFQTRSAWWYIQKSHSSKRLAQGTFSCLPGLESFLSYSPLLAATWCKTTKRACTKKSGVSCFKLLTKPSF